MKKRGVSRCAALLVVLLMMMSTAVMLPSQDATAQTRKVWGFVKNVNCILPVEGAVVSLTDVHGLDPSVITGANGYYEFLTGPGFYEVEVSKDGFFSQTKGPFRFDADTNMRVADFCLEPTPTSDCEVTGTVLSSMTSQVTLELVEFDTETMPEESTKGTLSGNTVELQNPPIVYGTYTGWWDHPSNGTDNVLVEGVGNDYTIDLWTGIVTIEDPWILSELPKNNVYLNFTYDHADNASKLDHGYISTYEAFKNSISWPLSSGDYTLDVDTGDLEIITGNFVFGFDTLEFTYEYHPTIIDGALVKIFNVTKDHTVDEDHSLSTGAYGLSTWAGAFELQAWATGYQPYLSNIQVTGDLSMWILMEPGIQINGWVTDSTGTTAVDNVRAFMLCLDPVPESIRLLEAEISGSSYYKISAYPGTFRLYVDADGYQGQDTPIVVTTDAVYDFALELSEEELVETSIGYVGDDWNEIAVYKNLTLNSDSHIPSLGTPNFGNLALEVDWTLGDKDGNLTVLEWDAFETWLEDRGPQFLKTSGFFTTEDEEYTLDPTGYDVTLTNDNVNVWIDTVATYSTSGIESNLDTYDLALNAAYDGSILIEGEDKILTNYTYWVHTPHGYELVWNSSVNTDVIGFTEIFVDPKKGIGSGNVILRLGRSDVGVAYAKIIDPQDCTLVEYKELCVSILNDDPENYLAVIPAEMDINFSAEDSTDPNSEEQDGRITPYANFTWDFGDGSPVGYGIIATHNYSDPGSGPGNYTVTLTIVEPGGNVTSRQINVSVDARAPSALVWFDENDKKLVDSQFHINEDIEFNIGANLSSDETWTGAEGEIRFWEWDLDSNGDVNHFTEMVDTEFYKEPGEYYLNLTVWDWVGHKSANYSKKILVDDVTAPLAAFKRMDSNFMETDFPFEQAPVYFNASETTDNFSTLENITFDWEIDETTPTGMNVSYIFPEPGEYPISLKATDEAENSGWFNMTLNVAPNRTLHSHISIPRDTLVFEPEKPEVGQSVKIRANITNSEEGIDATNLTVRFWIRGETGDKEITGTVKLYENGTLVSGSTLPVNTTFTAEMSWKPGSHGDYTILVNCTVDNEFPNSLGDNEIQGTLTVKEAGYITPLIIGVLVLLIFIIAIILLLRRRFSGRFPKLRKEKKPEKEKKKKKRVKK
jgi:hypothetical protein